jgi:hypothetical protein
LHVSIGLVHLAAGELVRLGDADQYEDAGQHLQGARAHGADVAGDADGGARGAGQGVRREVHAPDGGEDLFDLLRRGVAVHDDQHGCLSTGGGWKGPRSG